MKVAIISDVHVGQHPKYAKVNVATGLTDRAEAVLDTLINAMHFSVQLEVAAVIIAGDLFDHHRPTPKLIRRVADALKVATRAQIPVYVLVGNHDRTSEAEDAILPLAAIEGIHRVALPEVLGFTGYDPDEGVDNDQLILMYPAGMDDVPMTARVGGRGVAAIIAHHGIWAEGMSDYLQHAKGAVSLEEARLRMRAADCPLYLSGDWHEFRDFLVPEGRVVQIGALCPTGFNNPTSDVTQPSPYGTLLVLDSEKGLTRYVGDHPVFLADNVEPTPEMRAARFNTYTRRPRPWPMEEGDGNVKFVASASKRKSEAAQQAVVATAVYTRDGVFDTVVGSVMTDPAPPMPVKLEALQHLADYRSKPCG